MFYIVKIAPGSFYSAYAKKAPLFFTVLKAGKPQMAKSDCVTLASAHLHTSQ